MFFFFVFETSWKDLLFHSPILVSLWFRYLQRCIQESRMLKVESFSQLFLKTPHKTLEFQEKSMKNIFYSNLQT